MFLEGLSANDWFAKKFLVSVFSSWLHLLYCCIFFVAVFARYDICIPLLHLLQSFDPCCIVFARLIVLPWSTAVNRFVPSSCVPTDTRTQTQAHTHTHTLTHPSARTRIHTPELIPLSSALYAYVAHKCTRPRTRASTGMRVYVCLITPASILPYSEGRVLDRALDQSIRVRCITRLYTLTNMPEQTPFFSFPLQNGLFWCFLNDRHTRTQTQIRARTRQNSSLASRLHS